MFSEQSNYFKRSTYSFFKPEQVHISFFLNQDHIKHLKLQSWELTHWKARAAAPQKMRFFSLFLAKNIHTNIHILASQQLCQTGSECCWNCSEHCTHLHAVQKDLMKNVWVTVQKKRAYLSLVLNHSKPPTGVNQMQQATPRPPAQGWQRQADCWRKATAERLPTITCGTVHHVRCHAVRRSLRVHQARAVVHRLSIGGAGSHNTALIHGREIALPTRRKSTHTMSHYVPHCWRCCGLSQSTSPIVCK